MAYAGHQFGNFVHQLGDGRAVLLGEIISKDGLRFDLQLKGEALEKLFSLGPAMVALPLARSLENIL